MLKTLHKNDTQITPFIATKNWELSNVTNDDLILMEHSGSDGLPVALEYLNYGPDNAMTASGCNMALENQTADKVLFRDGLRTEGIFYPETDPTNTDGTFQRMVYSQVVTMFYNNYRDPTKVWGLEEIDLEKSQTKKFIADKFKMFNIPQSIFGEKIIENSVVLFDSTTDNNYIITDDGNCNLFAGTNLFSHQQELGDYRNVLVTGSEGGCDDYNTISLPDVPILSVLYNPCNISNQLSWNVNLLPVVNYVIYKSTDGVVYNQFQSLSSSFHTFQDTSASIGNTYWYKMYVTNRLGTSSFSSPVSASAVVVSWDNNADIWDIPKTCGPTNWNG